MDCSCPTHSQQVRGRASVWASLNTENRALWIVAPDFRAGTASQQAVPTILNFSLSRAFLWADAAFHARICGLKLRTNPLYMARYDQVKPDQAQRRKKKKRLDFLLLHKFCFYFPGVFNRLCPMTELLLLLSHFSLSDSVRPHRRQPARLPRPGISRQGHWSGVPLPSVHDKTTICQILYGFKHVCPLISVCGWLFLMYFNWSNVSQLTECRNMRIPLSCSRQVCKTFVKL